ncbi:hypothetical protein GCM10007173_12550 [Glutamicibacter ardleyensis]|uniref:Uncharacterized protein n=2 Tax=Glutamicibacter TaxID=1742989 RepID=A0ABQ2DFB6_9MICC|nr:hypothetical protein GCM10007173_12550 [Glutamicibacter ardleyensis]
MVIWAGSGNAGASELNFEALLHYPTAPAHAIRFTILKNGTVWRAPPHETARRGGDGQTDPSITSELWQRPRAITGTSWLMKKNSEPRIPLKGIRGSLF